MNAEVFVDTNIFLYAIDEDPALAGKRDIARKLLLSVPWGLVRPGRRRVLRQRHFTQKAISVDNR